MTTDLLEYKRDSLIRWLEEAELEGIERVLDVGCGCGLVSRRLRELYPDAEIFALDRDMEILFHALESGNLEAGYTIHGDALNLENPKNPTVHPEKFYLVEIKEGETGPCYGIHDIWKRVNRTISTPPRDFDLVVSHDVAPLIKFKYLMEASTKHGHRVVGVGSVGSAVGEGGYLLYSMPAYTLLSQDFDEKKAEAIAEDMVGTAKSFGFECLEWKVVGDIDEYMKNKYNELNIGILCRRK